MLIHKATMGVLDHVYCCDPNAPGKDLKPFHHDATFRLFPWLDRGEWWEVPYDSRLAKIARKYYPDLKAETDEAGRLVGLTSTKALIKEAGAADAMACIKRARREEARQRGYSGRQIDLRPINSMPWLRIKEGPLGTNPAPDLSLAMPHAVEYILEERDASAKPEALKSQQNNKEEI